MFLIYRISGIDAFRFNLATCTNYVFHGNAISLNFLNGETTVLKFDNGSIGYKALQIIDESISKGVQFLDLKEELK